MVVFFGLWILASAVGLMGPQIPTFVSVALGLIFLVGFPASIVLAIVGLLEISRHPHRGLRGKKRAISVLVLCGLMLLFIGFALSSPPLMNRQTTDLPEKSLSYDDLNFRISVPHPWVETERKFNPESTLSLLSASPQMFAMIIAEKIGSGSRWDTETLASFVKSYLASADPSSKVLSETRTREKGMNVVKMETDLEMNGQPVFYAHWLVVHNGYSYQLACWGNRRLRDDIRSAVSQLASRFQLVDCTRNEHSDNGDDMPDFHSPAYGFTVKTSGSAWTYPWRNIEKEAPLAEFGVLSPDGNGALTVTAVNLFGSDPSLDALEAMVAGWLSASSSNLIASDVVSYKRDGFDGRALTAECINNGTTFIHRIRILKGMDRVCVLDAWHSKIAESVLPLLDEELDLVAMDKEKSSVLEPEQLEKHDAVRHGLIFNEIGLFYFKARQFPESLGYFRRAFEFSKSDPAILGNVIEAMVRSGKYHEAVEYIDRQIDSFPQDKELALSRALAQSLAGDVDGSIKSYSGIFSSGFRNDVHFATYLGLLSRKGEDDRALGECEQYLGGGDSLAIRIEEAWLHCKRKDFERANALLDAEEKKHAKDPMLARAIAEVNFAAERYTETIAQCEKLSSNGYDSAYVDFLRGRSLFAMKQYPEAKTAFETALKKDPANGDIKAFLDHVSGMLGEGENSTVKNRIPPVPVPDGMLDGIEPERYPEYLKGYGAYYLHKVTAVSFAKHEEFKITRSGTVKVLDANGVAKFSTLQFPFDPLSEEIFLNSLVVKDADGKVLSEGNVSDSYVVDDKTTETATQRKTLLVPVRGLQPGCTLEYRISWRDFGGGFQAPFLQHTFSDSLPVLRSALLVSAVPEHLKHSQSPAVPDPVKTDDTRLWVVDTPVIYKREPLQEPTEKFLPTVWLGGGSSEWKTVCADYLSEIREKLAVSPAVCDAAQCETEGVKTNEEKIPALSRFVQRTLTYKALEFGRRARIPNSASTTMENRYGDCKDHAVLLQQMLEASGVTAHLALVNTVGGVQETLPSLEQFNHMIVVIPGREGDRFVDATCKEANMNSHAPAGLAGKKALVLEPKNPHFSTIPPLKSRIEIRRQISLAEGTDATIHEKVCLEGPPAVVLRGALNAVEPTERKALLIQQLASLVPLIEITNVEMENVDQPGVPLLIDISYRARQRFHMFGDQLVGQLPGLWEHFSFWSDPVENRQTPFRFLNPVEMRGSVTFTIPEGFRMQDTGSVSRLISAKFITGSVSEKNGRHELEFEFTLSQGTGHFPAEAYGEYQKNIGTAVDAVEPEISLKKSEG